MKIYKGERLYPEQGTISDVTVTVDSKPLKHHIYHSPTGFNWGYSGSGPADLARSILWDYLEKEPPKVLYQSFKDTFVATWKDEWQITSQEIQGWIKEKMYWEDIL